MTIHKRARGLVYVGEIALPTHSSTECALTGAARPSGDGVASDRTAELEMARGEQGTADRVVRAGRRERRGRRVRIMEEAVARGLPESESDQRQVNWTRCQMDLRDWRNTGIQWWLRGGEDRRDRTEPIGGSEAVSN
jgi:hypothetical protein